MGSKKRSADTASAMKPALSGECPSPPWGSAVTYEQLLTILHSQHALAMQEKETEVASLQACLEGLSAGLPEGERHFVQALQMKDEEAALAMASKHKELELMVGLLQMREQQIEEFRQLCESQRSEIKELRRPRHHSRSSAQGLSAAATGARSAALLMTEDNRGIGNTLVRSSASRTAAEALEGGGVAGGGSGFRRSSRTPPRPPPTRVGEREEESESSIFFTRDAISCSSAAGSSAFVGARGDDKPRSRTRLAQDVHTLRNRLEELEGSITHQHRHGAHLARSLAAKSERVEALEREVRGLRSGKQQELQHLSRDCPTPPTACPGTAAGSVNGSTAPNEEASEAKASRACRNHSMSTPVLHQHAVPTPPLSVPSMEVGAMEIAAAAAAAAAHSAPMTSSPRLRSTPRWDRQPSVATLFDPAADALPVTCPSFAATTSPAGGLAESTDVAAAEAGDISWDGRSVNGLGGGCEGKSPPPSGSETPSSIGAGVSRLTVPAHVEGDRDRGDSGGSRVFGIGSGSQRQSEREDDGDEAAETRLNQRELLREMQRLRWQMAELERVANKQTVSSDGERGGAKSAVAADDDGGGSGASRANFVGSAPLDRRAGVGESAGSSVGGGGGGAGGRTSGRSSAAGSACGSTRTYRTGGASTVAPGAAGGSTSGGSARGPTRRVSNSAALDSLGWSSTLSDGPASTAAAAIALPEPVPQLVGWEYRPHSSGDQLDSALAELVNNRESRYFRLRALLCRLEPGIYLCGSRRVRLRLVHAERGAVGPGEGLILVASEDGGQTWADLEDHMCAAGSSSSVSPALWNREPMSC